MECHASDSKNVIKVFDASKGKRSKKKREEPNETISVMTDDSGSLAQPTACSAKASLQDVATAKGDWPAGSTQRKRSSLSGSPSPEPRDAHRRYRRPPRNEVSLALKAGLISTPRSTSPQREGDVTQGQDSFIYTFLEEAMNKNKKHRHSRRHEEPRNRDRERERDRDRNHDRERDRDRDRDHEPDHNREDDHENEHDHDCEHDRDNDREHDQDRNRNREHDRVRNRDRDDEHRDRTDHTDRDHTRVRRSHETSANRDHRHRHYRRRRNDAQGDKPEGEHVPIIDQALLLETFTKLCSTITKKNAMVSPIIDVGPTQSHKSLQCEEVQVDPFEVDQKPVRLGRREVTHERLRSPRHARSFENVPDSRQDPYRSPSRFLYDQKDKYSMLYENDCPKCTSKMNVSSSRRDVNVERFTAAYPKKCYIDHPCRYEPELRDYRECEDHRDLIKERRILEDDRRRYCEQKASKSFDIHGEAYPEDERFRRTARSESYRKRCDDSKCIRERRYDDRDKCYERRRDKYYELKEKESRDHHCNPLVNKDHHSRRNMERIEKNSVVSREDDLRDRCSERERDFGLSVADVDTSTVSGRSNYLKVVKQEITEQREAMDKMMKLWKELMRCFKSMSQNQTQDKTIKESADSMQESTAAQMRLWRECMRRYETVARDVGDTDARLMEEIAKQRSEMAEMSTMWQECLQRYRDISSDFKNLKQKLANDSPTRQPPLVCSEGEGIVPPAPFRLPPSYAPPPPMGAMPGYTGGSPLRSRASAPPAWWWCNGQEPVQPGRRRSSPESRRSHSRERRNRHKERDNSRSRNKEKSSSKQTVRSEHRHRKR